MFKKVIITILIIIIVLLVIILYYLNIIPHKKYYNNDFNIITYKSSIDKDNDGIDDQTDILNNAKEYIKKRPKYKSKYYASGYPDDEYGVCSDVIGYALLNSGYDLRWLVSDDINNNREEYNIVVPDDKIDFRRVKNLKIFLDRNAISLTTDLNDINSWQGGDIVVFEKHIAIISNIRNSKGISYIIHHANPYQINYEEDILDYYSDIIGHYRMS